MACPCTFDASIPWECVRELIGMVRDGSLVSNPGHAMEHACCLGGSVGAMWCNTPHDGDQPHAFGVANGMTLEELCSTLEATSASTSTVTSDLLTMLITFIKKILEALISGE